MKLVLAVMMAMALATAACTKPTDGVESDGRCTAATVDSLSKILRNANMYEKTPDVSYLTEISNQCAKYRSLIGTDSCKVQDENGEIKSITAADVKPLCDSVDQALGIGNQLAPEPNGNCVSILNLVHKKAESLEKEYESTKNLQILETIVRDCDNYEKATKDTACKGKDFSDEVDVAITRSKLNQICLKAKETLASEKKNADGTKVDSKKTP